MTPAFRVVYKKGKETRAGVTSLDVFSTRPPKDLFKRNQQVQTLRLG